MYVYNCIQLISETAKALKTTKEFQHNFAKRISILKLLKTKKNPKKFKKISLSSSETSEPPNNFLSSKVSITPSKRHLTSIPVIISPLDQKRNKLNISSNRNKKRSSTSFTTVKQLRSRHIFFDLPINEKHS